MPPLSIPVRTSYTLHRHSTDPVRQRDPLIEAERDNNKQKNNKENKNNKNVTCDSYDD